MFCLAWAAHTSGQRPSSPDPDALSARYRGWHYYPDWIIPPLCMNPFTCANASGSSAAATGGITDVFSLWQTPEQPGVFRAVYLQMDSIGYETYSATSRDMVTFDLEDPTLAPGQPGVMFSPRPGRPPIADPKPVPGAFDHGGITFIGPLLQNYTVGAPAVLKRSTRGRFWYAYGAYPKPGYEARPGADGMASSVDGVHWTRETPFPLVDTDAAHGAGTWERGSVYAPFLYPRLDGTLGDMYNAADEGGTERSGAAFLPGGEAALPGWDAATNTSLWQVCQVEGPPCAWIV